MESGAAINVNARAKRWMKFFAAGSLLVLCTVPVSAAPSGQPRQRSDPPQSSASLAAARSELARGNPDAAIQTLSAYLKSHPKDVSARFVLGQAYAGAGKFAEAEEQFQTVLKAAPNNAIALTALAELYLRSDKAGKAEPLLGRASKLSHGDPQIRLEWAMTLARLHKYQEAERGLAGLSPPGAPDERIRFYRLKASIALGLGNSASAASEMEKALAAKPQDSGMIVATAMAQVQAGHWKRAAELTEPLFSRTQDPMAGLVLLEAKLGLQENFAGTLVALRAIQLSPADEVAFRQRLAETLVAHGDYAESIKDLKAATQLAPSRPELYFDLALAQYHSGQLDDALESAQKSSGLHDGAEVEDLLGDIQEARGDNLAAVRSYQAAVALAPGEEKYRLSLAVEFIRHKSFEPARVVLQEAEKLDPKSWRIQLARGMVEYFAGTDDEACRILERAAQLAPDPQIALKYLGDIEMDRASAPDPAAITQLCSYADHNPKDGRVQFYCGALQFRRDYASGEKANSEDIIHRLQTAAALQPNDASPHCQLGRVYRWLGQWPPALRESEACVRLDPGSSEAHYHLAQIYQHEGKKEQALNEIKLYQEASKRLAEANAHREETIKTFLYTIQKETPDRK